MEIILVAGGIFVAIGLITLCLLWWSWHETLRWMDDELGGLGEPWSDREATAPSRRASIHGTQL